MHEFNADARSYKQIGYLGEPGGAEMSNGPLDYQLAKLHQKRLLEDANPIEIRWTLRSSRRHLRNSTNLVIRLGGVAAIVTIIVLVSQQ